MRHRTPTHLTLAALTAVALAACGGETTSVDTTVPAATSTTAPVASTSTTVVATTTAPSTTAKATTTTAKPSPTTSPAPSFDLYEPVPAPQLPSGHTDPFNGSGALADGVYWAVHTGDGAGGPTFEVYQAFFGDECVSEAESRGDECLNDIFVPADEYRTVEGMKWGDDAVISVSDVNTQQSYRITAAELATLQTGSPGAGAPSGFMYVPFAFMVTVEDGKITGYEQVWTP